MEATNLMSDDPTRRSMNAQERQLIEELKSTLDDKLPRILVDAYLAQEGPEGILSCAVKLLERVVDKHETH